VAAAMLSRRMKFLIKPGFGDPGNNLFGKASAQYSRLCTPEI
jgi:hypothetical protein